MERERYRIPFLTPQNAAKPAPPVITISNVLKPAHIDLNLDVSTLQEAILHVATRLRGDPRILEWNDFYSSLNSGNAGVTGGSVMKLCVPHVRTNSVTAMLMGVGRSDKGIVVPGEKQPVHFVFAIGVPVAMASDYLRIVGSLARIFRAPENEAPLRSLATPAEFLEFLDECAMRL